MKKWKGKLSDKDKEEIRELREKNPKFWTYKKLSEIFNVTTYTIGYHLNPKTRERCKRNALKWKSKNKQKVKEYQRWYMRTRYQEDPEFRERLKGFAKTYAQKNRLRLNKYRRDYEKRRREKKRIQKKLGKKRKV